MKRFLAILFASVMFTSCDWVIDPIVTQHDMVGTWGFYINQSHWGEITINQYGKCTVCHKGYMATAYKPSDYIYDEGVFRVSNSYVSINIPGWPCGTFQIKPSRWVYNRYLIDPYMGGGSRIVLTADPNANLMDFIFGPTQW